MQWSVIISLEVAHFLCRLDPQIALHTNLGLLGDVKDRGIKTQSFHQTYRDFQTCKQT